MTKIIELNIFVKLNSTASTGGQAKMMIRSGKVKVNGEIELQNRKKLVLGDTVEIDGKKFKVPEEVLREKVEE